MNITILGCGAFGNAMGIAFLNNNNNNVTIWSKFQEEVDSLRDKYTDISYTTDLRKAINNCDLIVVAIPIDFIRDTIIELKEYYSNQNIVIVSKGIDSDNKFAYQIITDILGDIELGVISGGSFAKDMIDGNIVGLTLGTNSSNIKDKVKKSLESNMIKIQYSDDIVGVSICGAIKNVIAIGCGILDGAFYPESSRFLFLTEAIYEIKYIIHSLEGSASTILSYAGLDDILMTCTSTKSRNYTFGKMIGNNENADNYRKNNTIEGFGTSKAIYNIIKENNIYAPICTLIYQILYENKRYNSIIKYLEKKES